MTKEKNDGISLTLTIPLVNYSVTLCSKKCKCGISGLLSSLEIMSITEYCKSIGIKHSVCCWYSFVTRCGMVYTLAIGLLPFIPH